MRLLTGKLRLKSILPAPFEHHKKQSVTACSCARIIHYTSGILVKVTYFSQLFFHVLILKALTKHNVTDH